MRGHALAVVINHSPLTALWGGLIYLELGHLVVVEVGWHSTVGGQDHLMQVIDVGQVVHSTWVIPNRGAAHSSLSTRGFWSGHDGIVVARWTSVRLIFVVFIKSLLLLVPFNCLIYLAQ